jgi:hypothetical protein
MWPRLNRFKKILRQEGVSFIDLDRKGILGIECLNYVKKAKVYIGLDTGMSHYVSKFANGKTLALNGGFAAFDFWAYLYDYQCIEVPSVPCRPCYINKREIKSGERFCDKRNMCMREIEPGLVFREVVKRLDK